MKGQISNRIYQFVVALGFASIIASSLLIVACGKDNTNNEPPPGNLVGCPAGTYYSNGYCFNTNGTQVGALSGLNFISDNYQRRNLNVRSASSYESFLQKALGVCDRAAVSGGVYACSAWRNGYMQVVLQSSTGQANTMRAIFYAYPYSNGYSWYGYQLPSLSQFFLGLVGLPSFQEVGAMINPLPLNFTVSVVNQNKGFEGRAYGDIHTLANRSLIQIIIANGKFEDSYFDYELGFEGVVFASGRFVRY